MNKYSYIAFVICLFTIGAFLRLYHFPDRLTFGPEQGMSLSTAADNLNKFSLLGETNFQRATSQNHIPFHGAYYSYLLIPLLLLFNFRVLPITFIFALFNLFTGLILFQVTRKLFGKTIALFSLVYFTFSAVMIHHSLFAWILNPLPLLGILTLWFLSRVIANRKRVLPSFWLGVIAGFGFGLQMLFLPFSFAVFLLLLIFSKKKLLTVIAFVAGGLVGDLPMVIFDLRHDFYHLGTLWQYFLDVYVTHSVSGFTDYYHFLHLFPYLFLALAFITTLLYKIYKPLAIIPILIFIQINLSSSMFSLVRSTGMPPGITLATLELAAKTIAQDNPPTKFNIATLWDFDTVARPMRYLLQYNHKLVPQDFANYADLDALYVFAPDSYDLKDPKVWELRTFLPYKIKPLNSPTDGYRLYKLTK